MAKIKKLCQLVLSYIQIVSFNFDTASSYHECLKINAKCRYMVSYSAKEPTIEYGLNIKTNSVFKPYIERTFCFDNTKLGLPFLSGILFS